MDVSKKTRPPGISMVRSHALRAAATGMRVAPLREVPGVPPEQPSDDGAKELPRRALRPRISFLCDLRIRETPTFALVLPAGHELDAIDVKHVSPIRLVL